MSHNHKELTEKFLGYLRTYAVNLRASRDLDYVQRCELARGIDVLCKAVESRDEVNGDLLLVIFALADRYRPVELWEPCKPMPDADVFYERILAYADSVKKRRKKT